VAAMLRRIRPFQGEYNIKIAVPNVIYVEITLRPAYSILG